MKKIHGNLVISRSPNIPVQSNYKDYLTTLRNDFKNICGYCGKSERVTKSAFHIDHFVPKVLDNSRINDYTNLVYSCSQCNIIKGHKWPTRDINLSHDGTIGIVDPATNEFHNHLQKRKNTGEIIGRTDLGNYMINTIFKFNTRPIQEIDKIMKLYDRNDEIHLKITRTPNNISRKELLELPKISKEISEILDLFFEKKE